MGRKKKTDQLNVFDYSDYRQFLTDWLATAKRERRQVSYRWISERAGFKSHNFFRLVVIGKRNLSSESLAKVIALLKLNKQEAEYFRNLVGFNQAKKQQEKDFYYQHILSSLKYRKLKPLAKDQYEFFSKWYFPMVRELVNLKDFDGTPEWISSNISPSITTDEAREALSLLERLNLIEKVGQKWKQTSAIVSTGAEVSSLLAMKYHQEILRMSADTLPDVHYSIRDVTAMNASCSWETVGEIKKRIQRFKKEIVKLISMDKKTETAIMMNIQVLPFIKFKL